MNCNNTNEVLNQRYWDHHTKQWLYHSPESHIDHDTTITGTFAVSLMICLLWLYSVYRMWMVWAYTLNFDQATVTTPKGWDFVVHWISHRVSIRKRGRTRKKGVIANKEAHEAILSLVQNADETSRAITPLPEIPGFGPVHYVHHSTVLPAVHSTAPVLPLRPVLPEVCVHPAAQIIAPLHHQPVTVHIDDEKLKKKFPIRKLSIIKQASLGSDASPRSYSSDVSASNDGSNSKCEKRIFPGPTIHRLRTRSTSVIHQPDEDTTIRSLKLEKLNKKRIVNRVRKMNITTSQIYPSTLRTRSVSVVEKGSLSRITPSPSTTPTINENQPELKNLREYKKNLSIPDGNLLMLEFDDIRPCKSLP